MTVSADLVVASRGSAWLPAAVAAAVVVVSGIPRIALAAGTLPEAARAFVWSDLLVSYEQLLAGGHVPYWQTVFYYPPVVGYTAGAFAVATADAIGYLAAWTVLLAVAAAAIAALLARTAGARRTLIVWSAAPQVLLYSGMNFDVLVAGALAAAILLMRSGRSTAAFAALAIGTLIKVSPATVVPVLLDGLRSDRRRALTAGAMFAAVGLALGLPSVLAPHPPTAFAGQYVGLTNLDSFWGLPRTALGDAVLAVIEPITAIGLLATYLLGVIPTARRVRGEAGVAAGLAVVTVLLWSRLYSPQYSIWVLPFFALVALPLRWYALMTIADVAVFFTVYPLTLRHWDAEPTLHSVAVVVLATAIVLRQLALLEIWLALRRLAIAPPRVREASP